MFRMNVMFLGKYYRNILKVKIIRRKKGKTALTAIVGAVFLLAMDCLE